MNIFKIVVLGVFCLLSLSISGQNNIVNHKTIEWLDPVKIKINDEDKVILRVKNNSYTDPESLQLTIHESVTLPENISPESIKVTISDLEFVWPNPIEHQSFFDIVNNDSLELTSSISQSGKEYYLDYSLIPLQKPLGAASFQKLISYSINISYQLNNESTLKSISEESNYAENSVLSTGDWFKVKITETGVHKIPYSTLESWGISNPQNVGIYGNGGRMIPAENNVFREDDLVENSVWHANNSVYFYAQGPTVWDYNPSLGFFTHSKHKYSNSSYYFITEKNNNSKLIESSNLQNDTYSQETDYFNDFAYHEVDNINLIHSGNVWYGERFGYYSSLEHNFTFSFPNIKKGKESRAYIKLAARSSKVSKFKLNLNEFPIDSTSISSVDVSTDVAYYAHEGYINTRFSPSSDTLDFTLVYELPSGSNSSLGYLDYICINTCRNLIFINDQLQFRNTDISFSNTFAKYNLTSTTNNLELWDVTDPLTPLNVANSTTNTNISFVYSTSDLREFVAFDPTGDLPTPTYISEVVNQNLHGLSNANYIIVCHPDFTEQAERLGEIHRNNTGLTYIVTTTDKIYNEFSSGKPDATAIRSFVRMFYDRAGEDENKKPKSLLLFGDGSYDNREGIDDNTNKIPTYQSDNSIHLTHSYVSDDYFGFLDSSEGSNMTTDRLDIGIGRFPVNTTEEATNAVDRSEKYMEQQTLDSWKSHLTFVGDDEDNNIHMEQSNELTIKVNNNHPEYNISKLFFDAYPKVTTSTGKSIPELENKIYNALHEGTLIFNYTGHGGTNALGHEHVITKTHIAQWKNINKLSLFVTATCEFSRFDDKDETSAGEMVFLNPLGGGIGLFTTTRIAYSTPNFDLNNNFYNHIFEIDDEGEPLSFGEVMKKTKHNTGNTINKLNFTFLGDPALKLIYPRKKVLTTTINGDSIKYPNQIDSLKALSFTEIEGRITNTLEELSSDFNGEVFISVYDKPTLVTTLGNDGADPFQFETYNSMIFKGRSTITDGKFVSEFVVPQDIRYNYDNAKISYYAYSEENTEAFGAFGDIIVGGIDTESIPNEQGPDIELWLNNRSFKSGGQTTPMPLLIADIFDENGINTTGSGIGHDLTCIIDGDVSNPIVLNSLFQADLNSYKNGSINYQLSEMDAGTHTLKVKAWDTQNNSSEKEITFNISNTSSVQISNCTVYPNPVISGTSSYFYFEHDEPNVSLDIDILIYNLNGQLISSSNTSVVSLNNTIPPIEWNTSTAEGQQLISGVYLYQLIVKSQTGRKGKVSGKIMVTQ